MFGLRQSVLEHSQLSNSLPGSSLRRAGRSPRVSHLRRQIRACEVEGQPLDEEARDIAEDAQIFANRSLKLPLTILHYCDDY